MIAIDLPEVVAEVTAASLAYEAALAEGDVEALVQAFWSSGLALRIGDDEELVGIDAITAFRREAGARPVRRTERLRRVTAYGTELASVHLVTEYPADETGTPGRVGRQSQWWLRTDVGWRIAEAHVSWPLRSVRLTTGAPASDVPPRPGEPAHATTPRRSTR